MKDDKFELIGLIKASNYRFEILKQLSVNSMTPTDLSHKTQINKGHISRTLKELGEKNLTFCANNNAKKGRMYCVTEKGREILSFL